MCLSKDALHYHFLFNSVPFLERTVMAASREEEIVAEKLINEGNISSMIGLTSRIQDMEEELVGR
jgi:hypothetical protein